MPRDDRGLASEFDPHNKRKAVRFPVIAGKLPPARIELFQPIYHKPFEVIIRDLSEGGMKVESPERLPHHFEFELEFELPKTIRFRTKAKAVFTKKEGQYFDVGVQFVDLDSFVREHIHEMARDWETCEKRIEREESNPCRQDCQALDLCSKPQKAY